MIFCNFLFCLSAEWVKTLKGKTSLLEEQNLAFKGRLLVRRVSSFGEQIDGHISRHPKMSSIEKLEEKLWKYTNSSCAFQL